MALPNVPCYTRADIYRECSNFDKAAIIINNVLYDVSVFMDYHPGGFFLLIQLAGQDATHYFYQQGHSARALVIREVLVVGQVVDHERWPEIGPGGEPVLGGSTSLVGSPFLEPEVLGAAWRLMCTICVVLTFVVVICVSVYQLVIKKLLFKSY